MWIWLLLVLGSDWITKYWVMQAMELGDSWPVIEGIFHLTHIQNPGIAFGLLPGNPALFAGVNLVVAAGFMVWFYRAASGMVYAAPAVGLIVGGALGNFIDRWFRGRVVDFLDFRVWPVFNVADAAIVVGCALLVLSIVLHERMEVKTSHE